MTDLVSIYIPTKNRLRLLSRAVNSVLAQSHRNLELIVVSDGSTDGTCDYVRNLKSDISVRLIHNEQSQGACAARNQALQVASGRFVTGLDDDDIFLPDRIECFVREWHRLEQDGKRFSCLFDRRIVNAGQSAYLWDTAAEVDEEGILRSNAMGNQIFTTPARLIDAGMFDASMPAWQDWETWVRVVRKFGPAVSICANTYVMDVSHEFERVTLKPAERIVAAAQIFYDKHCQPRHVPGLLRSLAGYDQVRLSSRDLLTLLGSGSYYAKFALRHIKSKKFRVSMTSTINAG